MRISDWSSDVCSSDLSGRGRRIQHEIQGADCPETDGHAINRIVVRVDPEFEVETPFRVAGVVQDHRLEHGRVGNAQMIAFKRHQNGRTAGEPHDTTFMTTSEEHTSEHKSLMRIS